MFEKLEAFNDDEFIRICLAQRVLERKQREAREQERKNAEHDLEPFEKVLAEELERIGEKNGFIEKAEKKD